MLKQLADNIWTVTSQFKVFGLIGLNGRTVIIRLAQGGLWVHSPIQLTETLKVEIDQLGTVEHLISPNLFHHLYLGAWKAAYPQAQIYAPPGLEKKQPDLNIDHELSDRNQACIQSWSDEIAHVSLSGMPAVREQIFYHQASRTVIVTDFCFYFTEAKGFTKLYLKLNRVYGRLNTPLIFKSAIKDHDAFKTALEELKHWEVDRITLCHHAVLEDHAQEQWLNLLNQ